MAATRQNAYYVHGNTVRKIRPDQEITREPKKKVNNSVRRNRDRAKHMSAGYVLFLSMALVATGIILVYYIGLQSDITNSVKHISSSVDLEEIRRIAIQELGMQYAQEGQIISFTSENNDYVKQMAEIPKQD